MEKVYQKRFRKRMTWIRCKEDSVKEINNQKFNVKRLNRKV